MNETTNEFTPHIPLDITNSFPHSNMSSASNNTRGVVQSRYSCLNPSCSTPRPHFSSQQRLWIHLDSYEICQKYYTRSLKKPRVVKQPPSIVGTTSTTAPVILEGEPDNSYIDMGGDDNVLPPPKGDAECNSGRSNCPSGSNSSSSHNNENETDTDGDDDSVLGVSGYSETTPVITLEPNLPLYNSEHGDFELYNSSDESTSSFEEECSTSEDSSGGEASEDEGQGSFVEHSTEADQENHSFDHFVNSASSDERPPKVFDYKDHVDGLYTPRKWIQQWIDWSQKTFDSYVNDEKVENLFPDDLSLLRLLLSDPNYQPGWHFMSESERAEIKLMNSLDDIKGCPLYVYDAVVKWAKTTLSTPTSLDESDSFLPLMRSRENFLKEAPGYAHTTGMKPVTRTIHLPGCRKNVSLTTMSYKANLYHFLTNRDLVNDKSLLIPGATPHDDPPAVPPSHFDDVNTGTRFLKSWTSMKKEDIDFPLGDMFFVDKSHLDVNGRLCAEPVNHTFTLVKREARNQSDAW